MAQQDYEYEELKDTTDIRILRLYPDDETQPLKGSLEIRKPGQEYEALSWTWGTEPDAWDLEILDAKDDSSKGFLRIKPNLTSALRRLRYRSREYRYLWIDAICIQQKRDEEKNNQVQMMARIYSQAKNVRVWLGEDKEESDSAVEFIKEKVVKLGGFDKLVNDKDTPAVWQSLVALMNRDWFSRRWVVQEIALAKQATLHCGKAEVAWPQFAAAVALFERRSDRIAQHFKGSEAYEYNPEFIGDVTAMGASRLVRTTSNLYRKSDDGRIIDRLLSLEALVSILSDFKARERHDTIYAMLALAKDTWQESSLGPQSANTTAPPSPTMMIHRGGEYPNGDVSSEFVDTRENGQSWTYGKPEDGDGHEPPAKGERSRQRKSDQCYQESSQERSKKKRKKKSKPCKSKDNGTRKNSQEDAVEQRVVPVLNVPAHPSTSAQPVPTPTEKALLHRLNVSGKWKRAVDPKNTQRLKVDYKLPFLEVCKRFMTFSIGKSESLDILCRPWAPEDEADPLPSWIPTLAGTAFGMEMDDNAPGGRRMTRQNADPLVGSSSLGRRTYTACKSLTARYDEDWGFRDAMTDRIMFVTGFVLDTVGAASVPASFGNIPPQWIRMGWPDKTRPTPERFWRTLVADRGPDGLNVPVYYELAWDHACNPSSQKQGTWDRLVSRGINTTDRIHHGRSTILAEFLQRVQSVIWNRKLIQTKKGAYLGLGPEDTHEGDSICILRGCSVPVVLRKTTSAGAHPVYKLVGEAYVHGMMDGEAIDLQERKKIPHQKFDIE